jgi:hypothetical protein
MNYHPKITFSMSYMSHKVIFPGGEIAWDYSTLCSAKIVELWTRKRVIGDEDENNGDVSRNQR